MIQLSHRRKITKIDNKYSTWKETLFWVPQGSMLGPLLFNIHMCDLFFLAVESMDLGNYDDDTTPYAFCKDFDLITKNLK